MKWGSVKLSLNNNSDDNNNNNNNNESLRVFMYNEINISTHFRETKIFKVI